MKLGALTLSALAAQAAALSFDGSLPAFHTHWSPKPPAIDVATAAEAAAVEATWLPTEAARDLKRKKWMKARAARRKEMLTEQEDQSPSFFLSLPAFASEATFTPPPTPRSPPPYSAAPPSTSMSALASSETDLFEFKVRLYIWIIFDSSLVKICYYSLLFERLPALRAVFPLV
jgi:hypothetical protein